MKAEDRLLFVLSRQILTPEHRRIALDLCMGGGIDWETIYVVAHTNKVSPLIAYHLQNLEGPVLAIPQPVMEKLRISQYNSVLRREMKFARLNDALHYFRQHGIDVMLIKGAALEQLVYAQTWLVMSDDVDIVLRPRRNALPGHMHRQFETHFHGSNIEFDYFAHHDINLNGALPIDFEQIWADAAAIDLAGGRVFVMSPEDMLLSLCINSCRKRYFRLKSLFDIAETIAKYPNLNWQKFVQRARAWRCNNIVYSALLVTQLTVGFAGSDEVLAELRIPSVKAALIRSLVHILLNRISLAHLAPYSETDIMGRPVNLSVVLPYLTYDFSQARMMLNGAYRAWRGGGQQI